MAGTWTVSRDQYHIYHDEHCGLNLCGPKCVDLARVAGPDDLLIRREDLPAAIERAYKLNTESNGGRNPTLADRVMAALADTLEKK